MDYASKIKRREYDNLSSQTVYVNTHFNMTVENGHLCYTSISASIKTTQRQLQMNQASVLIPDKHMHRWHGEVITSQTYIFVLLLNNMS